LTIQPTLTVLRTVARRISAQEDTFVQLFFCEWSNPLSFLLRQFRQLKAGQLYFVGQLWQDSQASTGFAGRKLSARMPVLPAAGQLHEAHRGPALPNPGRPAPASPGKS